MIFITRRCDLSWSALYKKRHLSYVVFRTSPNSDKNIEVHAEIGWGRPATFEISTPQVRRVVRRLLFRQNSLLGSVRGRRNVELGQLTREQLVFGEFCDELFKLCAGYFYLSFAKRGQGQ